MDVTFSTFLGQIVSNPVLAVTVILALGAIFVNGWTDAPNAIATCVTTRCMPARAAILMSAAFNFLGVLIMTHFNASVANTISHIVDFGGNSTMARSRASARRCSPSSSTAPQRRVLVSPPRKATALSPA